MKKVYEAPQVQRIEFDVEEALMASVISGSKTPVIEIGGGAVDLW